jgi:UDP-2-acetamido-2,6-beta-L-arabino-hexul-4-ose reductase
MLNILVTGSRGFVGKNLCVALRQLKQVVLFEYDLDNSPEDLHRALSVAEVVFHLAGVNRPRDVSEYQVGNAGSTNDLCLQLSSLQRAPKIVFSSSIQAEQDNPYGKSKVDAEAILREYAQSSGAECVIYRLKNLFGKWGKPNYNAVTATFCYNTAHDYPLVVSDPSHEMELTYIDDVVKAFVGEISPGAAGFRYADPLVSYKTTLGELADIVSSFRRMRSSLQVPDFSRPFIRALYATYLSYLEKDDFAYQLVQRNDPRGSLAEFIKSPGIGQVFVSRTRPGALRGNHFHNTKTEKFLVLQGYAIIRLRHVLETSAIEIRVRGEDYQVVDIPPGYTHSIQNVGDTDVITVFWSDEIFDPGSPDTFPELV